ncbi:MAG: 6-bladed beta-propeller [Dysgonamonadaceae bacterium]|nr:6-bladed beta-propeller [Dysgonamonadaceae bacterium]
MKKCLLFAVMLACIACNKTRNSTAEVPVSDEDNRFLTVDVSKEYPMSDRIRLQDIAEVEYVPLETNDDFLCAGRVFYIDNSIIIYVNGKNGEILIFDRQGKAKHKINRKGQSGEEYATVSCCLYDKEKNELYVSDMMLKKIFVYDIEGNYKRSFWHLPGAQYNRIYLFDEQYLLCYNNRIDSFE